MARLLIKFTKTNRAKFISHLDTMRTMHRAFRRAALPIAYSQGFNPHASISVAAPLSLGIESIAEYADIDINGQFDTETMKRELNAALPMDIKILEILEIKGKAIASMAAVSLARYSIRFCITNIEIDSNKIIHDILTQKEIMKLKRTKAGEKLVDIRPLIENILLEEETEDAVTFEALLAAGSNGSLSADLLVNLIKEVSMGKLVAHPFIRREEIYTLQDNTKTTLLRYFTGK